MNKTQASCSQKGSDGLNEADHRLAEIRESQECKELAVEMFLDDVWATLGNTADEGFWKGHVVVDPNSLSLFWHCIKIQAHAIAVDYLHRVNPGGEFGWGLRVLREQYEDAAAEKIFNEEG